MQSLKVVFWMIFLFPLFYTRIGDVGDFLAALALLLPLKIWNLWAHWLELRAEERPILHLLLRVGSNGLITLWLFSGGLFGWPLLYVISGSPRSLYIIGRCIPTTGLSLGIDCSCGKRTGCFRLVPAGRPFRRCSSDQQRNQATSPVQSFAPPPPSPPAGEYLSVSVLANFLPLWGTLRCLCAVNGSDGSAGRLPAGRMVAVGTGATPGHAPHWHSTSLDSSNPPLSTLVSSLPSPGQSETNRLVPARLCFVGGTSHSSGDLTMVVVEPTFASLLPLLLGIGWGTAWILGRLWLPKRLHKQSSSLL